MATRSKAKGTGGERELLRLLNDKGFRLRRREAGAEADLFQDGEHPDSAHLKVLAVRPDRGRWLFTVDLDSFLEFAATSDALDVEVKRPARSWIHSVWRHKFEEE